MRKLIVPILLSLVPPSCGVHHRDYELTAEGIAQLAVDRKIRGVDELLIQLPVSFRESYVFLERSGSLHHAFVQQPRAILFGTDARFLMGIGSVETDPRNQTVDMAQLDTQTGYWQFRTLEFADRGLPILNSDQRPCESCHGLPARPIWGSYPAWPGAFGDQVSDVTPQQAETLRRIRSIPTERFYPLPYDAFYSYMLSARRYGYPNTAFNFELAAAAAEGLYKRVRQRESFPSQRYQLLWNGWCTYDVVTALMSVGLSARNDFQLHRIFPETSGERDYYWNQGSTYLHDLWLFLVLDNLVQDDLLLAQIFSPVETRRQRWINHWWRIVGEARREFLRVEFDFEQDDIRPQELIIPIRQEMCAYLRGKVEHVSR